MGVRKIAVVTGSRADYGLLQWLMREIRDDPALHLQTIVTGAHLAPEFGSTQLDVERDDFRIDALVECQLSSDSRVGSVKSLAIGTLSMADALRHLQPHLVVVLGDRYEVLAAAQAAALMGIPLAHISGGEVTEGATDDWIRHAITKASWWHFAAAEPYRKRIVQLGEAPERVYNVGDPALDSIRRLPILDRETLERELQMTLRPPVFLVTYHTETLSAAAPAESFNCLLAALERFPQATVVLTKPNADAGGRELASLAQQWAGRHAARALCFTSLGQLRYLSVMRSADAVIGNSSSGIVEAPPLKVATVNIGARQNGRLKATSIIDCDESTESIFAAVSRALSAPFRAQLPATVSLYGDCEASSAIKRILSAAPLPITLAKKFHDL
jgi:UDP-hydrolysing UDP-N-acetyl-D-glucosamine 2-epimerase